MLEAAVQASKNYCNSLVAYSRRKTIEVTIGSVPLGEDNPIRVQSMTTVDTMDTMGSVEQTIRMVDAGCEYVRITAPSIKEAQNLENIRKELRKRGYDVPLIADIHFTPNAAELAARIVEKVRINPGNYADKKKFEIIEYTDSQYHGELERIREKFLPLVKICKEYGTAMRIGTNHGSLSDRIMSRYGDTPLGMVESAMEFLRITNAEGFHNIVLSMKASNTQVMVQAYRLLVQKLQEEGFPPYPLHLGVTEAGEAEDGRIKSAVGIGTLLEDGLGDTVRVSLTEEPEFEAPVAAALVNRYDNRLPHNIIPECEEEKISYNPYEYKRRQTKEVFSVGNENVPRVIADFSSFALKELSDLKSAGHFYLPELDKWTMNDLGVDFIYTGSKPSPFMLPNGLREIMDAETWQKQQDKKNAFPLFNVDNFGELPKHNELNFLRLSDLEYHNTELSSFKEIPLVLLLHTSNTHALAALRRVFIDLEENKLNIPVIIERSYNELTADQLQLYASTDIGGLLIDGLGDGVLLRVDSKDEIKPYNQLAFGILQAARTRITKTEYISCPSCGRTLFDLQETTAMIRKRTDHLKGIKIGIMGCIVNGPGEMADADYGYVGSGKGKITLYKGKEVMKRSIPSDQALDELIEIIRADGKWTEPENVN